MSDATPTSDGFSTSSVFDNYAEKQLLAAFYGLIFVTGVLGNSSLLLSVVLSKKLRTTTNVFVINMAMADLFTCLSLPIMILAVLSESREELLVSDDLCSLEGFVIVVCIGCSINSIASIAVYRALITRRKNRSRLIWLFNRRGLAAMVAINWLVSIAVGIIPIVSEFGSYEYDDKISTCTFNPTAQGSGTFSKISIAVYCPVQFLATFVSYSYILFMVKSHSRRVNLQPLATVSGVMRLASNSQPGMSSKLRPPAVHEAFSGNDQLPSPAQAPTSQQSSHAATASDPARPRHRARAKPQSRRNMDVTISLFLVVFFFFICWTPYSVLIVLLKDASRKFVPFLGALLIANSCINPMIYTTRHPDFRAVLPCIILCRFSKIPMKSDFLLRLLRLQR